MASHVFRHAASRHPARPRQARVSRTPVVPVGLVLAASLLGAAAPLAAAPGRGLAGTGAALPQTTAPQDVGVEGEPLSAPDERRLLRLADERVLRARSRCVAGRWEIHARGSWQALPAGSVVSAAAERDVLREARALERRVDRRQPHQRVGYATWLADQGLWAEALEELDDVLAEEPDHPQALALLASGQVRLALPEATDTDAFLRHAAGFGPAGAELAILAMRAAKPEVTQWKPALAAELLATTPRRRAFAARALRRLLPGEAVVPLLRRALLDPSPEVRAQSSQALGAADEGVIVPVVGLLEHSNDTIRVRAAEALGQLGFAAAVPPLVAHLTNLEKGSAIAGSPRSHVFIGTQTAYISDFDVEVAQGASIAKPKIGVIGSGDMLDARILATTFDSGARASRSAQKRATRRALERLTGAHPGRRAADWQRWLDASQAEPAER